MLRRSRLLIFCFISLDDLKLLVLQKYPNSLGKQVDPVDIDIQCFPKQSDNIGTPEEYSNGIIASPEESVFGLLDRLFPNGLMSISDAFLIVVSHIHSQIIQQQPVNHGSPSTLLPGFGINTTGKITQEEPQGLGSPVLGAPFSLPESGASKLSSAPFVKSIPNHGLREIENPNQATYSNSTGSAESPSSSIEQRNSLDGFRESSPTLSQSLYTSSSANPTTNAPSNISISLANMSLPLNSTTAPTNSGLASTTNNTASVNQGDTDNPVNNRTKRSHGRDKTGNGVILLPKQFKNQNSTGGNRKGQSRLSIDGGLGNLPTQSSSPTPETGTKDNMRTSSTQASSSASSQSRGHPMSISREDVNHTKNGAYQRLKSAPLLSTSPSSSPQQEGQLEVASKSYFNRKRISDDASAAAAAAVAAAANVSHPESESSGEPSGGITRLKAKRDEPVKERRTSSNSKSRNTPSTSSANLAKLNITSSHARQGRDTNNQRVTQQTASGSATTGTEAHSNTNSITNNRKLLLSINKGISPYTTVVPQINVLIVEDNVINQKILETFLKKRKIRSATAKNGKEAIEKWRQGGFHLVLMDIQLPVMNGIEATKKIRQLEHQNRIGVFSSVVSDSTETAVGKTEEVLDTKLFRSPVIIVALTASSSLADKSEALAAGCNDFLTKPVNLKWLEQKTIEWGCMQALIDFEGWKHWVSREPNLQSTTSSNTTKSNLPSSSTTSSNSTSSGLPSSTSRKNLAGLNRPTIERGRSSSAIRRNQKDSSIPSSSSSVRLAKSPSGGSSDRKSPGPSIRGSPSSSSSSLSNNAFLHLSPMTPVSPITGPPNTHNATAIKPSSVVTGTGAPLEDGGLVSPLPTTPAATSPIAGMSETAEKLLLSPTIRALAAPSPALIRSQSAPRPSSSPSSSTSKSSNFPFS